jgi:hypothetical protein
MRTAALREYEALEDEERREAGRSRLVNRPMLLREDGTTIPPQRSGGSADVARLQE